MEKELICNMSLDSCPKSCKHTKAHTKCKGYRDCKFADTNVKCMPEFDPKDELAN